MKLIILGVVILFIIMIAVNLSHKKSNNLEKTHKKELEEIFDERFDEEIL